MVNKSLTIVIHFRKRRCKLGAKKKTGISNKNITMVNNLREDAHPIKLTGAFSKYEGIILWH